MREPLCKDGEMKGEGLGEGEVLCYRDDKGEAGVGEKESKITEGGKDRVGWPSGSVAGIQPYL